MSNSKEFKLNYDVIFIYKYKYIGNMEVQNVLMSVSGNEWKTRYETQTEINEQLERQILNLQNKVEEAKSNLKDGTYHMTSV